MMSHLAASENVREDPSGISGAPIKAAALLGASMAEGLRRELPDYDLDAVFVEDSGLRATAMVRGSGADCPACGLWSGELHSRYWRTVRDLLPTGMHVVLRVNVRRFRCRSRTCAQLIFAERLPGVAMRARRTDRLSQVIASIALQAGGLPGTRMAALYGLRCSRDTMLRAARATPLPQIGQARVLGVDDFSYRRGTRYGTLLFDCELRRLVALLPDRSAHSFATWLRAHPGIEVISRDRSGAYAEGAALGAPAAIQVADRFHLLKNLGDCLERLAQRIGIPPMIEQGEPLPPAPPSPPTPHSQADRAKAATRDRRLQRQRMIRELHSQGLSDRAIGRALHLSRQTVSRYLHGEHVPDNARRRRPGILDPYPSHLQRRWAEGCHRVSRVYLEIQALGYSGSLANLRWYIRQWRGEWFPLVAGTTRPRVTTVSPSQFRRLCLIPAHKRTPQDARLLERLAASDSRLAQGIALGAEFARIVRTRQVADLDVFLSTAAASSKEFAAFANSLRRDLDAVRQGIAGPWSQGPVEGAINRLKTIKRAMYGRGNPDLLSRRVLFRTVG